MVWLTAFGRSEQPESCNNWLHLPLCQLFSELGTIWELAFALAICGARLGGKPQGMCKKGEQSSLVL